MKEVKQRLVDKDLHIEPREESGTLMDFATTLATTIAMPTVKDGSRMGMSEHVMSEYLIKKDINAKGKLAKIYFTSLLIRLDLKTSSSQQVNTRVSSLADLLRGEATVDADFGK